MRRFLAAIPVIFGVAVCAAPTVGSAQTSAPMSTTVSASSTTSGQGGAGKSGGGGGINVMADACSGCHGTDGQSLGAMPAFNTKTSAELKKMLRDYKSGAREATIMDRITKGYSEAQLDAIVDYFKK